MRQYILYILSWLTLSVQGSELGAVGSGWIGPLLVLTLYSWDFLQLSLLGRPPLR